MKKKLLFLSCIALSLSGCTMIQESMDGLECNRQAIDASTQAINENTDAIEAANRKIVENRRQLDEVNKIIEKAGAS